MLVLKIKNGSLFSALPVVLLLLSGGGVAAQTSAPTAASTTPFVRFVSVNGNCLKSVQPDRGSITVTADVLSQDLQSSARKATESYERLKSAIQKMGLKNLELNTTEYSFQEFREWEKDKNVFKGFRARMGLNVSTSELARLGEVIALAAKEGIREVSGLSTFLSAEKAKAEKEACLEEAVRNARSKAETVARAANAKLGRVLTVSEEGAPPPQPVPIRQYKMEAMAAADMSAPTVVAGPQKMSIDVAVSFALE